MGKDAEREEGYLTSAARGPNTAEEGVPNRKPAAVFIEEKIEELVKLIQETYQSSRERSLAVTNIEQGALWLSRCNEVKFNQHDIAYHTSAKEDIKLFDVGGR